MISPESLKCNSNILIHTEPNYKTSHVVLSLISLVCGCMLMHYIYYKMQNTKSTILTHIQMHTIVHKINGFLTSIDSPHYNSN